MRHPPQPGRPPRATHGGKRPRGIAARGFRGVWGWGNVDSYSHAMSLNPKVVAFAKLLFIWCLVMVKT